MKEKLPVIRYAYKVTAENVGTGTIDVVGIFGEDDNDSVKFRDEVQAWLARGCSKITVRVNSRGGCLFTAFAMYDALRAARAAACEVVAEVHGVAASAATVFLMGASAIYMSENSQLMVHAPSTCVWGHLDELQEQVDALRDAWLRMAELYAARMGQTVEQLAEQLRRDTWFTAQQAIDAGLADGLVPAFNLPAEPEEKPAGGLRQAARDIARATSSWLLPRKRTALANAPAEPGESNPAATPRSRWTPCAMRGFAWRSFTLPAWGRPWSNWLSSSGGTPGLPLSRLSTQASLMVSCLPSTCLLSRRKSPPVGCVRPRATSPALLLHGCCPASAPPLRMPRLSPARATPQLPLCRSCSSALLCRLSNWGICGGLSLRRSGNC